MEKSLKMGLAPVCGLLQCPWGYDLVRTLGPPLIPRDTADPQRMHLSRPEEQWRPWRAEVGLSSGHVACSASCTTSFPHLAAGQHWPPPWCPVSHAVPSRPAFALSSVLSLGLSLRVSSGLTVLMAGQCLLSSAQPTPEQGDRADPPPCPLEEPGPMRCGSH